VGFGLATLLEQSAEAYRVVKIAGGLYLVYLGVAAFLRSRNASAAEATDGHQRLLRTGVAQSFLAGLASCLLNPKVGLFFLAVVPQFLPHNRASFGMTMLLGGIVSLISMIYLGILALVATRAMLWLKKPKVAAALERVSAAILAALGIGTVASAA
jgi:threonine/homoserine/homoserine lactone efflux protein